MTMPDPLESLSDGELSEVFAVEFAGYERPILPVKEWEEHGDYDGFVARLRDNRGKRVPSFGTSANAILPWLQQSPFDVEVCFSNTCANWTVRLLGRFLSNAEFKADAETFARAACLALIRSARATQQDCGVRE